MTALAPPSAAASFQFCRALVRQSASNFAMAFRLLPAPQRRAMDALYAFMRVTDDISDEPGDVSEKRARLLSWREALSAAIGGHDSHPLHPALRQTVAHYGVDPKYLFEVLDGVAADLEPVRFETFEELYPYCFRVASAVGLACLPIWGCRDPRAAAPGEAAGIAFQLTNILRDLGEDLGRGRVYLPRDEWERFRCPPVRWSARGPDFAEMLRLQIDRAKRYYAEAERLNEHLPPPGRAIFRVMFRTYRELLAEIERRDGDVFHRRVKVPRRKKAMIFASAWPVKWGWW
ncbi:phytoene/squalene synthase family protein [Limnoglobus roseus]|uniref:Squalene/phytoene synthase family protein n=1 Tax=Limnoglobus roseus TaxID=2598579 RepID=A0A5C1APS6_9BACT|nr:phytoene/squalene synthase family protein [Limnoglobus roseus]QEL20113.1 squalene/phytoene synthase family protein [Limnoglobus roseus]